MEQQVDSQADGARARLEEIFRRCSPDLHRYVQRRLQRSADVPDLTQEIFERFIKGDWQARARNPHAYLFGIASNVVAEAWLAQKREVVTFDSEVSHQASESISGVRSGEAESVSLEDELTQALEQLPESHRVAILLTKRDGLSGREAAARMKVSEASVRVYVCEGRARLKTILKRWER